MGVLGSSLSFNILTLFRPPGQSPRFKLSAPVVRKVDLHASEFRVLS